MFYGVRGVGRFCSNCSLNFALCIGKNSTSWLRWSQDEQTWARKLNFAVWRSLLLSVLFQRKRHRYPWLYHVQERIYILFVPPEILMVYEPLDLFFYHLLLWDEHVFKNFDKFCLKGSICYSLSHLHDLNNRLLKNKANQITRVIFTEAVDRLRLPWTGF